MNSIFIELVNISIMASWLVLAIIIIRVLFKKIPKSIYCILWGLVGLRLVFPFSIETKLSLIPSTNTIDTTIHHSRPTIQTGIEIVDSSVNNYISSNYYEGITVETNFFDSLTSTLSMIWIIGMILMILYSIYSYYKIYKQVQPSILYKDNIYYCDDIDSPFILGIFNPKIYIPSYLDEKQISYVLKHEQAHLKRIDHFYKPIGFILLIIYWFNPMMWIAYILLCRDIESACDEKVIQDMNNTSKKEYSETLFNCSVQRNMIMACPLAFGEVGVKERIKSVINYKKPSFWIILLSVLICIGISIGFLTNPLSTRIVDIDEPTIHITLFDNVSDIQLINNVNTVIIGHQDQVSEMSELLLDVKISNNPISQSRSEDRDKTNQIRIIYNNILDSNTYINISEDFKELWIDDGVKPTYSYKVKNPQLLKQIFEDYSENPGLKVVESFNAIILSMNDTSITVEPFAYEKEAEISNELIISKTDIDENVLKSLKLGSKIQIVYSGNLYKQHNKVSYVNAVYLLNEVSNTEQESFDALISKTILNYNYSKDNKGMIRVESHVVLSSEGSFEVTKNKVDLVREYLIVLYQEYNIENNELVLVNSKYTPTVITFKVIENDEYIFKDYWVPSEENYAKDIKEIFPGDSSNDALEKNKYYNQLEIENKEKAYNYLLSIQKEVIYEDILNTIISFDNGYTDEDYNKAIGEACLHPRVKYSSENIEIEIWSDPHRLFCYIVKIRDLNTLTYSNFYMDTDDFESIQKELEKYNFVKSYM